MNIKNSVILASAGSGKTFALTMRYIKLLHLNVPPERIIALTFTKKAAGEIFDKIIEMLLTWLLTEERMKNDCKKELPDMTQERALSLLKLIVNNQNKLFISTLDSFFLKILQTFPYEYGLNSNLKIINEEDYNSLRESLLRDVLQKKLAQKEQINLFESFKHSTFGKEETNIFKTLNEFIKVNYPKYMMMTNSNFWKLKDVTNANSLPIIDDKELADEFHNKDVKSEIFKKFKTALTNVNSFSENLLVDESIEKFFTKVLESIVRINDFKTMAEEDKILYIKFNRTEYPFRASAVYYAIYTYLNCMIINNDLKTKGIYSTLDFYHKKYREIISNTGKLTFEDVITTLQAFKLSSESTFIDDNQIYIDYRLNSRYDHWLIDEFQDTSKSQWNIISNLIDEIMSTEETGRSFFYVGDTKQAIFSWRGGDPFLFNEIKSKYKDRLIESKLITSYRSSKSVINTVNKLFLNLVEVRAIPEEVLELWNTTFSEHTTVKESAGYTSIRLYDEKDLEDDESRLPLKEIINKISEINPLSRNISVGILVLTNSDADLVETYLTKHGIICSKEGYFSLKNSICVQILLALVKIVHHPSNSISIGIIELTQLSKFLPNEDGRLKIDETIEQLLGEILHLGFNAFIEKWGRIIIDNLVKNESLSEKEQMEQLFYATKLYNSNDKDLSDYIFYIENYKIPIKANDKCIQIITIYKSKGLEYDMVIIPSLKATRNSLLKEKIEDDNILILADKNNKNERAAILPLRNYSLFNPYLANRIQLLDNKHCYEQLCVLYVALTRAKKALYIFSEIDSKSQTSLYLSTIINILFCASNELYEDGDRNWYQEEVFQSDSKNKVPKISEEDIHIVLANRKENIVPSEQEDVFETPNKKAVNTGICCHEILSMIDFLEEDSEIEGLVNNIKLVNSYNSDILRDSKKVIINALKNDKIKEFFKKDDSSQIWIEKEFASHIKDSKIYGRFDRVSIKRENNQITKVFLIDYKYSENTEEEEKIKSKYFRQMVCYKLAISNLLKINTGIIDSFLILLKSSTILKI